MNKPPSDRQRELQKDRPSATNRAWGESTDPGDLSFGKEGLGGFGDFREQADPASTDRDVQARGDAGGDTDGQRPDDMLRSAVAQTLAMHGPLDASEILVIAEDGVVTLTGEVPQPWMRDCAQDVAATVTGVREVRNLVRHDDGSASFGPPGQAVRAGHDQKGSAFASSARFGREGEDARSPTDDDARDRGRGGDRGG